MAPRVKSYTQVKAQSKFQSKDVPVTVPRTLFERAAEDIHAQRKLEREAANNMDGWENGAMWVMEDCRSGTVLDLMRPRGMDSSSRMTAGGSIREPQGRKTYE